MAASAGLAFMTKNFTAPVKQLRPIAIVKGFAPKSTRLAAHGFEKPGEMASGYLSKQISGARRLPAMAVFTFTHRVSRSPHSGTRVK